MRGGAAATDSHPAAGETDALEDAPVLELERRGAGDDHAAHLEGVPLDPWAASQATARSRTSTG